MSYSITLDATVLASGVSENVVVLADTSGTTEERAIAIDYSNYYKRIATALETIANELNSNRAGNLTSIFSVIESHLNANQNLIKLKNITGTFLQNELVTGNANGRVVSQIGNSLILDNITSNPANSGSITGSQSGIISNYTTWHPGKNIAQDIRQKTMMRLYIDDVSATNASISIPQNNQEWSRPSSATINETGTVTVTSNRSNINSLWLVDSLSYFPLVDTSIDKIAIIDERITGSGTSSLTFTSNYNSTGTYYVVNESDVDSGVPVAVVTITNENWITDEEIEGNIQGYGHLETYTAVSERGKRYLDVIDIKEDFRIGETITGKQSGKSANILDIIRLNHEHTTFGSSNGLGEAALYKLYVEEGQILKTDNNVSSDQLPSAITKLRRLRSQAGNI